MSRRPRAITRGHPKALARDLWARDLVTGPLLTAKSLIPPVRSTSVARPRLIERLLANDETRLTVVVAPAGWGKTTLLTQWAHDPREQRFVEWLSIDESDDDPGRFWMYVLTSLQSCMSGVGAASIASLLAPSLDPVDVALPTLLNELASVDEQHVLVLDDYHVLTHPGIHESVEFLLSYLPSSLRLVIAGRFDPPLPLARLRARGDLIEIRADDLRFTEPEAMSLFDVVGDVGLDSSSLDGLLRRTEGWAVGLQLAALTVRGAADPVQAAAEIGGGDRHILDYFIDEVLTQLPPDHRDLLVRTSILERLSGPLCDCVLDRPGSAAVLHELDKADVFVIPLDTVREWYRCHHLFRDVLRLELDALDPTAASTGLLRAADWFRWNDQVDEAIRHRMAAGDAVGASTMLQEQANWFIESALPTTYMQLAEQLHELGAISRPDVYLTMAFACGLNGRFSDVSRWLDEAERRSDADTPPLPGWASFEAGILSTRAAFTHFMDWDKDAAIDEAQRSADLETNWDSQGFAVTRAALAANLVWAERFDDAIEVLRLIRRTLSIQELHTVIRMQVEGLYVQSLFYTGRIDQAGRIIADLSHQANTLEAMWGDAAAPALSLLRIIEARCAYQLGDVQEALRLHERAVHLVAVWGTPTYVVMALVGLGEASLACGDRDGARSAVVRAREAADAERIAEYALRELEAFETRLGRGAARTARRAGSLYEELTDRELSILRLLPGTATQREIGASLYLSVNTVKGYTKSLYRKLGVVTRQDAVEQGRALGLI